MKSELIKRMSALKRSAFFDNAKVLLIFLVVFGHLIQPFTEDSTAVHIIYLWIYTFHMPAFIFLSGFFAKGSGNKTYIVKLAKKLLLPYLIFQLMYTVFYFWIGKDSWRTNIYEPHWALWFLFSLFSWHLLLIIFKRIPPKYGISLSFVIGIGSGYISEIGHELSLARTLVFFPFFLLGYWMTKEQLRFVKSKATMICAIIIMLAVAVAIHFVPDLSSGWLLASKSYEDLGMTVFGGVFRIAIYLVSIGMMFSLFTFVPVKPIAITEFGRRTLYVYLFHGFFIQYFRQMQYFEVNHILDIGALALIACMITIVLSSKVMLGIGQPFIEGNISRIRAYLKSGVHST